MIHDLTSQAGFALSLDTDTLEIATGPGIRFRREPRLIRDMQQVLYQPQALPPDDTLYWTLPLLDAGELQPAFQSMRLTFGLVLLPPKMAGKEFAKTHGHYHSPMPGSQTAYPEVYTHYFGDLYLYMQRRRQGKAAELDDCVVYRMLPGESIMIPPGYAHILFNPSDEPALMGGLYSPDAVHEYGPIREMAGAAYYWVSEAGQMHALPNEKYPAPPPVRQVRHLQDTRFSPPDPGRPLWSSFSADPHCYAFITDPLLAARQFAPEDLRR